MTRRNSGLIICSTNSDCFDQASNLHPMVICLTAFSCGILIKQKNWWKHMKNAYISNKIICFVLLIYLHFNAVGWHVGCIRNKQIKNTARPFFLGFLQPIKHLSSMLSVMYTRIFLEEQKCATRETCEHTHPTKNNNNTNHTSAAFE